MNKNDFIKFCEIYKKAEATGRELYKLGFDDMELRDPFYGMIGILMRTIFTEQGADVIDDYLMESWDGRWWEKDEPEIIHEVNSFGELFDYLVSTECVKETEHSVVKPSMTNEEKMQMLKDIFVKKGDVQ